MGTSRARKERRKQIDMASSPVAGALKEDVQIQESQGKGRGLFWNPSNEKMLVKGTTVLRLQPEVIVPDQMSIQTRCHVCYTKTEVGRASPQCCSGCNLVRYCSTTCKDSDKPLHQKECQALSALNISSYGSGAQYKEPVDPGAATRMVARLIWQRKRLGQNWWDATIGSLQGNSEALEGRSLLSDYLCGSVLDSSLSKDEKLANLGISSIKDLRHLYGLVERNAIQVVSSHMLEWGLALSSMAAMINHSCDPNAVVVFPEGAHVKNCMHIVVIKDVKVGEELTISYINTKEPYAFRQMELETTYSFQCSCSLCVKNKRALDGLSNRVDPREALWCGRSDCNGWVAVDWMECKPKGFCTGCKKASAMNAKMVANTLAQGMMLLMKIVTDKTALCRPLAEAKGVFKALTAIQPPSSHPLLELMSRFSNAIGVQAMSLTAAGKHEEAAMYHRDVYRCQMLTMAGYQAGNGAVYPEGHPNRCSAYFGLLIFVKRMKKTSRDQDVDWTWDDASPSVFFSRLPGIPTPSTPFGMVLLEKALEEIKIGYGSDAEKSGIYKTVMKISSGWI